MRWILLIAVAACSRERPSIVRQIEEQAREPPTPPSVPGAPPERVLGDARRVAEREVALGYATRDQIVATVVDGAKKDAPDGVDVTPYVEQLTDALLQAQRRREASWKRPTDCDRLEAALAKLRRRRIYPANSQLAPDVDVPDESRGWLQEDNLYAALDDGTLSIDYGTWDDDESDAAVLAVGDEIARALRGAHLHVKWSRSVDDQIELHDLVWHKRRFTDAPK